VNASASKDINERARMNFVPHKGCKASSDGGAKPQPKSTRRQQAETGALQRR